MLSRSALPIALSVLDPRTTAVLALDSARASPRRPLPLLPRSLPLPPLAPRTLETPPLRPFSAGFSAICLPARIGQIRL